MRGPIKFIARCGSGVFDAHYFYTVVGKRAPKKGEWYLSGAIVEAYQAPNDLTDEYTIVERGARAKQKLVWVPA